MLEALHNAVNTRQVIHLEPLQYNILSAVHNVGVLNWWDVKILPVVYDGIVRYLIVNTYNITSKILHQDAIEEASMRELTLTEDLAKTNVQLSTAITDLAKSHEELVSMKNELEELNKDLEQRVFDRSIKLYESEARQRELIYNAPVAIAALKGKDHTIETANKKIIQYWGKTDEIIGKPLVKALPEIQDQPFIEILDTVRQTGIAYSNPELSGYLNINGQLQRRYFDMVYQPVQHQAGVTDSIFIVATDITDHVIARQKLEQSESMLRLAVNSASIGTWTFEPGVKEISYNPMFAQILGWDKADVMTFDEAIAQVTITYREKVIEVIAKAINDGGEFDIIYSHKRFNDSRIIWLRATGRSSTSDSGNDRAYSGVIRELANYDPGL